jgi:hypothetical protein
MYLLFKSQLLFLGEIGRSAKLITYFLIVPRLRTRGTLPPLPHMSTALCLIKDRDTVAITCAKYKIKFT